MPATEQTWRDMKLLHRIFAASSLALLATTIWMLTADHRREWKSYQRTASRIETRLADWHQLQYQTELKRAERQRLEAAVAAAQRAPLDEELLEAFQTEVRADPATGDQDFSRIDELARQLAAADGVDGAEATRRALLAGLRTLVRNARDREEESSRQQKFAAADRDAAVAELVILVRDDRPESEQAAQQAIIDQLTTANSEWVRRFAAAETHRKSIDALVRQMTADEEAAADELAKHIAEWEKLAKANEQRESTYFVRRGILPLPGKRWLELPILDAFNSPRKIETVWSDGLEIDYNFRKVRRFDRCTTCHQLIDRTLSGTADQPAYPGERTVELVLSPESGHGVASNELVAESASARQQLERVWGLQLASGDLLARNAVAVTYVAPESAAARALPVARAAPALMSGRRLRQTLLHPQTPVETPDRGLRVGDVILSIGQMAVAGLADAEQRLVTAAASGQIVPLTVSRGLPHPYASHPRLDLYAGSLSPHPVSRFGCTVCHEGQGSATAFKWASHTPDNELARKSWKQEHRWFDNPDWRYPMWPERFSESACLKCHHRVTELESSERFPDAPAPKVTTGHRLIRAYGCFGCHEINGFDGLRAVGPDLRTERNVAAAALQLQNDPGFAEIGETEKDLVEQLIQHPDRAEPRQRIHEMLVADIAAGDPKFSRSTHNQLTPLFKATQYPGTLRRPGPSLRHVGHKLRDDFLVDWTAEPRRLRPTTRMPHSFGLWQHLDPESREISQRYEPLEILGIVAYLRRRTQSYPLLAPSTSRHDPDPDAAIVRGRILFQERGCLACHTHSEFGDAEVHRDPEEVVLGPDLSSLASKLSHDEGRRWFYGWIKRPTDYDPRTRMPETFLEPIEHEDGTVTDPAADIVEFLLAGPDAEREAVLGGALANAAAMDQQQLTWLDDLVREYLQDSFAESLADRFSRRGIPESYRDDTQEAEWELLVSDDRGEDPDFQLPLEKKLLYVGRKSIGRNGCFGCHDIPGFENAKPIGVSLSDWGRKSEGQLAFESILSYLEGSHGGAIGGQNDEVPPFYMQQIRGGRRAGFIYQKLREPRSYDYRRAENKKYTLRLQMPQFSLTGDQREAISTFVLGLVADPPVERYVYQPDALREAILAGQQVLDKYRCASCHILEPQRWKIAFPPGELGEQPTVKQYPFLQTHFTPRQLAASRVVGPSGFAQATLQGMPALDEDGLPMVFDEDGFPLEDADEYEQWLEYPLDLWRPAVVDGHRYEVGIVPLGVFAEWLEDRRPAAGGFLAKYLLPHVVRREREVNPSVKGAEAWGWLPPPLVDQGRKVQSDWLHDFLLNPAEIRPAVVMRMPRYNLSSEEATTLVRYFAAVDGAEYPYEYRRRRQSTHLAEAERQYQNALRSAAAVDPPRLRLDDAMKVVTDSNYCIKCHRVGDFDPKTSDRAKAPNLATAYERLRPEYLRRWSANPKSVLPYTGMPVNIPFDPDLPNLGGISQDLYLGTSVEQLEAVVDLLMNYDEYAKRHSPIAPLVKSATAGEPPAEE